MELKDKLLCIPNNSTIDLAEKGYIVINTDRHIWVKTSTTGKEMLEWLSLEHTYEELLDFVYENYAVGGNEIKGIIESTIQDFYKQGIISINGQLPKENRQFNEIESCGLQQLWLNITNRCNLKCPQCFAETKEVILEDLAYSEISKLLNECSDINLQEIIISGGEPCLHPEIINIIKLIKSQDINIKLLTNGSLVLLDNTIAKEIMGLVNDIQVSLDGITMEKHDGIRGKGSFSNVVKTLEILKTEKVRKGIAFTPLPENYEDIELLYDFSLNYELDYIHINRPSKPSKKKAYVETDYFLSDEFFNKIIESINILRRREAKKRDLFRSMEVKMPSINASFIPYKNLIDNTKKTRCAAGINTLSIMEDGSVYPCVSLSINRNKENMFGNIKKESILSIYQQMKEEMFKQFHVNKNEKCCSCQYKYFCGGGCRAAVDENGCDCLCETFKNEYQSFLGHLSLTNIRMLYNQRMEIDEKN